MRASIGLPLPAHGIPNLLAHLAVPYGLILIALGAVAIILWLTRRRLHTGLRHGLVLLPSGIASTTANSTYLTAYHRYTAAAPPTVRSKVARTATQAASYSHLSHWTAIWLTLTALAVLAPAAFYLIRLIRRFA